MNERAQQSDAYQQSLEIEQAIEKDDLARYVTALEKCSKKCLEHYQAASQLLDAADFGAKQIAKRLVEHSAPVPEGWPNKALHTCEGQYLPSMDALSLAIARDDAEIVSILLPVSGEFSRREALQTAAFLDRFELLQKLIRAGVPLPDKDMKYHFGKNLLVTAAKGAALKTGEWLISQQKAPVNAPVIQTDINVQDSPLQALMGFVHETNSPRGQQFMTLLIEHGADINAPLKNGDTLLKDAIKSRNTNQVKMLLQGGAKPHLLSAEQRAVMDQLLKMPDNPVELSKSNERCLQVNISYKTQK